MNSVAILTNQISEQIRTLAQHLQLPIIQSPDKSFSFYLIQTAEGLGLQDAGFSFNPLIIDFNSAQLVFRKKQGGGRSEPLAKAVGVKIDLKPTVLDVTGGLGRDAFILASLGCQVTLIERHPIMHALLQDALTREGNHLFKLIYANSIEYLSHLSYSPDVVYLDPMYPHRTKSALVKKEMRLLRQLVGEDEDANELFQAALHVHAKKVVVKRPAYAEPLSGIQPTSSIHSGNHRFDVYHPKFCS